MLSKAERRNAPSGYDYIFDELRTLSASLFEWHGLPSECPGDYTERALFDVGTIGIQRSSAVGDVVSAGAPYKYDHYGRVVEWVPLFPRGYSDTTNTLTQRQTSPLLNIGSMRERLEPYVGLIDQSLKSLHQNVYAMAQPVLLEGFTGNKVDGELLCWELASGQLNIPNIRDRGDAYKVLDLGVTDYTVALTECIDWAYAKILTTMGIKNPGTEKASGVTPEETLSISQQLVLSVDTQLKLRREWADAVNEVFGLSISANKNPLWDETSSTADELTGDA